MQKSVKGSIFLGWWPESIRIVLWSNPSSHFVQETLQKCDFDVNGEKPICDQKVMAELGVVLDLRTKMFHISNTETESI